MSGTQTETFTFSGIDTLVPAGTTITFIAASDSVGNFFVFNTATTNPDGSFSLTQTVPVSDVNFPDLFIGVSDPAGDNLAHALGGTTGIATFNVTVNGVVNPVVGMVSFSDTVDPTSAPVTKNEAVTPFAHFTLSDTVPTETIFASIMLSSGYSTSSPTKPAGIVSFSGTAAQLQSDIDSFTAKALSNGPGKIEVFLSGGSLGSASGGAGAGKATFAFAFNGTAPGGSGLVAPTADQIAVLTTDTMKFYSDQRSSASTAGDATNLVNKLSGLSIDKPTLGKLLSAALNDNGTGDVSNTTNAGTLGSDLANVFYGSINNDLQSQSSALSSDLTSMIKEAVAVGGTYNSLATMPGETAAQALAQTVSQYHLTG